MKETFEQKLAYGPMSALRTKPEAQGAAAGSNSVGPLLCATRMRVGKDLQDVARLLHIRYNYLVAIEDGRFEDLPGQAYAIGFVRAYAEHLGLDGAEIVRRFKDENSGVQHKSIQNYAVPAPASGVPSGVLLSIAVALGMVVYGAWYSFAGADRRAADLIQEIPDRLAVLLAPDPSAVPLSPIPGGVADASAISETAAVTAVAESPGAQVAAPDSEVTASTADDEPAENEPAENEPAENETAAEMAVAEALPTPRAIVPKAEPLAASQIAAPATVPAAPQASSATTTAPSIPLKEVAAPVVEAAKPAPAATELKQPELKQPEPRQPVPEVVTAKVEAPKAAAPKTDQPAAVAPAPTVTTTTPAPTPNTVAVQAPPPVPTPAPAASPAAGRETQVAALPPPAAAVAPAKPSAKSSGDVIELRATSDSWIQVRAGDQLLLTRLLRKGEVYRVPDRTGLTLMTGNAGGLDVMVNGTTMPPLGNEGTVARGVPLEASRLKTMAAASEPAADSDEPDAD
jgi:cytoskeleton protein RodZ